MADALCGPSNALQNFQKHTAVDRTLQQDRLVSRQSPTQGFRSAPNANAGFLDPEFDAFQAGLAPPHLQHHVPLPHFAQQQPIGLPQQGGQLPGWAADFQRLNISSPPPSIQQQQQQQHLAQASGAAAWHQDFLRQQQQQPQQMASQAQPQTYAQNPFAGAQTGFGPMAGFQGPAFQHHAPFAATGLQNNMMPMSSVAQGKQRASEPQISDSAFEEAFQRAEQEMQEAETKTTHPRLEDVIKGPTMQAIHRYQAATGDNTLMVAHPLAIEVADALIKYHKETGKWVRKVTITSADQNDNVFVAKPNMAGAQLEEELEKYFLPKEDVQLAETHSNPAVRENLAALRLHASRFLALKEFWGAFCMELIDDLVNAVKVHKQLTGLTIPMMQDQPWDEELYKTRLMHALPQLYGNTETREATLRYPVLREPEIGSDGVAVGDRIVELEEGESLTRWAREQQMSTEPLFGPTDADLERQANGVENMENEQNVRPVERQEEERKKEEEVPQRNDDDAMAETAGHLLERVSDNTSEKFRNSQFLELMRRLRDREVRVEGDKMVETNPTLAGDRIPSN